MKKITSQFFSVLVLCLVLLISSYSNAQVGINIKPPNLDTNQTLDVNGDARMRSNAWIQGDARLDGAFLPGNAAGGVDQMLLSQGTSTPPVWGPGFINTAAIVNIGKYYALLPTINNNTYWTIIVPDSDMTPGSTVVVNFVGPLPAAGPPPPPTPQIRWGDNITILADPQLNQVVFYITNFSGYNISNLQISYVAYYD